MSISIPLQVRSAFLTAIISLSAAFAAVAQTETAFVVYPEFQNVLTNAQNNPPSQNSFALFSGNYNAPATAPTSAEGIKLVQSSFGEPFARVVPYPNFEIATIQSAQTLLYPPANAITRDLIADSGTAFR